MPIKIPPSTLHPQNGPTHTDPISSNGRNGSNFLGSKFTLETLNGQINLKAGDILEELLKHKGNCDGKEGKPHSVFGKDSLPSLYFSVLVDHFKLNNLLELRKIMNSFLQEGFFESPDPAKKFFKITMTDKAEVALAGWRNTSQDSDAESLSNSKEVTGTPGYGEAAVDKRRKVKEEKEVDWTTLITDITALAGEEGSLKIVSRPKDTDLNRLKIGLSRSLTHSVFLVGRDGVGKSSIVQELASQIKSDKAGGLNGHKILRISLSFPELAEVMPDIYDFALKHPDVIFYFDDIDSVFISEDEIQPKILRQLGKFINSNGIKTISEMTPFAAQKLLSKNPNWAQKVDEIKIEETDLETTLAIVRENLKVLEKKQGVNYKEVDLEQTIALCKNYVANASFPKKVLDVLDRAGAVAKSDERETVTMEDVSFTLSKITGLSLGVINEDERAKLLRLNGTLADRVLGQPEAIEKVSDALRLKIARLTNSERGTAGVFMFLGPTGVGKTELAKALAEWWTGDEENLVRLDMGEYMYDHNVSRITGAPPGYVGYEEGGELTNAGIRRPFGVVLFDEIEKAHPRVFNILLPLFDEGRLTDGQGKTVDFKNWIIIMTSNIATGEIQKILTAQKIPAQNGGATSDTQTKIDTAVSAGLEHLFSPEQLNRIDEVIIFNDLPGNIQRKIVKNKLDKYLSSVEKDSGLSIDVMGSAIDFLKEKLFERKSGVHDRQGGRKVLDILRIHFKIPLTNFVLKEGIQKGAKLQAFYDIKTDSVKFEKA